MRHRSATPQARLGLALAAALACAGHACGDDDPATSADAGGEDDASAPVELFSCPEGVILAPGENEMWIGPHLRQFFVDLPADTSAPMGVLFSWHGFGGEYQAFRDALAFDPDADPDFPLAVITPEDTKMLPPFGLGWDIRAGKEADVNRDIKFFAAMLTCAQEQLPVDPERIYSFGFSAGSVMTSLLHSRFPERLSAVVAESGAWFNDPGEAALVQGFDIDWSWPELDPADGGAVLLTHGGPNDLAGGAGINVLDLEASAQLAVPFLTAAGRVVVDCVHDGGHVLHPEVTPAIIYAFFAQHRAGEPSPLLSGELEGFPESCTLRR